MDYVDDARVVLRKMEKNHIGSKQAMFFSAYALYYEKQKKFQEAEKMYLLGVQNLAEPAVELQKSHEQFLRRMKLLEERKTKKLTCVEKTTVPENIRLEKGEDSKVFHVPTFKSEDQHKNDDQINKSTNLNESSDRDEVSRGISATDDTVVVKFFVGNAIVGKSEAENALHHGLVDPTINMKEAMSAISNMFKEPLESEPTAKRKSHQSKPKENQENNVLKVYVDESPNLQIRQNESKVQKPFTGAFKFWTDNDDENDTDKKLSTGKNYAKICDDVRLKDDRVIRKFMGSTVSDDHHLENACHHGLVDPTINMKEAMDDINGMFGEPLNFVRAKRPKKQEILSNEKKLETQGFCILADDDLEEDLRGEFLKNVPCNKVIDADLFEPTVCTREAMAEINEIFGKSLDF